MFWIEKVPHMCSFNANKVASWWRLRLTPLSISCLRQNGNEYMQYSYFKHQKSPHPRHHFIQKVFRHNPANMMYRISIGTILFRYFDVSEQYRSDTYPIHHVCWKSMWTRRSFYWHVVLGTCDRIWRSWRYLNCQVHTCTPKMPCIWNVWKRWQWSVNSNIIRACCDCSSEYFLC